MVTTIVLADDHPIVLGGLKSLIGSDERFEVVDAAVDGLLAWEAIRRHQPHLAVLDLNMPSMTGAQVLAAIKREALSTRGILLAAAASDAEIYDSVTAGAVGVILKEAAPEMLMDCLVEVVGGGLWMPAELVEPAMTRETERRKRWGQLAPMLTPREVEIVGLILAGVSNKEMAFRLHVSDGTAKVHINNVFRKMQVSSRVELVRLAADQPIIRRSQEN